MIRKKPRRAQRTQRKIVLFLLFFAISAISPVFSSSLRAQVRYATGQDVVPVFEGWERNADGSFNMVFGYMNRNYEEEVDVPVGPNNTLEPGSIDQGQPAHFYPRRQQYVFSVRVPKDWGKKDLVWTLTSHGKTEKAYATLMPTWEIDAGTYQQNRGGPGELGEADDPPSIKVEGAPQRETVVGTSLVIDAFVTDDFTVMHPDDPLRGPADFFIVCHENDRHAVLMQFPENRHHFFSGRGIQISGWLVRKNDNRLIHKRPRDCYALLLSAGKFVRAVTDPIAQPDSFQ